MDKIINVCSTFLQFITCYADLANLIKNWLPSHRVIQEKWKGWRFL